jgi:NAD(P)-dependent dehydrogenase (short-subunit alcohol dehydrogenase family)
MKTWLLTGCSSGFGQRLALAAAKRGDRVIATARNVTTIKEMATSSRKHYRETNNGSQAGDPDKAIAVILQAVDADDAPLHLPLGPIAHAIAERKLAAFRSDIDAWRDITIATDFDQP